MMTAFAALWGARGLALIGALLIALLGAKGWLMARDAKVAAKAQAAVVEKVKQKADKNVDTSQRVRKAVAQGKRGAADPNRFDRP